MTGKAIVLMPGPYDSQRKKVNKVKAYNVFGAHTLQTAKRRETTKNY